MKTAAIIQPDAWALDILAQFPAQLRSALKRHYIKLRNRALRSIGREGIFDDGREREANTWLRELAAALPNRGLPLSASEADIRSYAEDCSKHVLMMQNIRLPEASYIKFVTDRGLEVPQGVNWHSQLKRLEDEVWWRKRLRVANSRMTEALHVVMGNIHRRAEVYCSADGLKNRRDQKRRNSALMQALIAVNELGDEFTLQQLSDVSVSNPAIRRAELMTRIAGFEEIARSTGMAGEFITITAPSKYHARHAESGKENNKYIGTTPRDAQFYLRKVWARIMAELARSKIRVFGFRVAEPHHDGTPHWHGLLFVRKDQCKRFRAIVAKHATREDRCELGLQYAKTRREALAIARMLKKQKGNEGRKIKDLADSINTESNFWQDYQDKVFRSIKARVTIKKIDWSRGTAAGYIAKYIAKNIDGRRNDGSSIGVDYEAGAYVAETAERVDTWASRWGIRQFQQIGGPPVTIWRELRRLKVDDLTDKNAITQAAQAADKGDWGKFVQVMGGIEIRRKDMALGLFKDDPETSNKYGEPAQPIIQGVTDRTTGEFIQTRVHDWEVRTKKFQDFMQASADYSTNQARVARPWTCVNNSTNQSIDHQARTVANCSEPKRTIIKSLQAFSRWAFDWASWAGKKIDGLKARRRRKIYTKTSQVYEEFKQQNEFLTAYNKHLTDCLRAFS